MAPKIEILAVVGPTASGKTKVSIELAKILNGEIVSADSMQIYKHMNIGTAKPTQEEMQGIPHHLMDFLDVDKNFSVADYVRLANKKISEISLKNKLPIICGGTGLYVNSLIDNIQFDNATTDIKIRQELKNRLEKEGIATLMAELSSFDKETAQKLHPNDFLRIIRAIEVYKTTGVTMSHQIKNSKRRDSIYTPTIIGLSYKNRENLYENINKRVDCMVDRGLIEETREILAKNPGKTAMNAICYKEILPYLKNECDKNTAVENLKKATRHYAKRQLTWFKKEERVKWIYVDDYNDFKDILKSCTKYIDFSKNM